MRDFPRRLTAVLLFGLFAFCVYRARTQSLTADEAWVFKRYVSQPWTEMAREYDAVNHVLHTALMKLCVAQWGIGEVVLRVPTLLGALLYFTAVFRLSAVLFSGWSQPVAAAALTMHPLVLDLLVAARGYGLALGLFAWSLVCALRFLMQGYNPRALNLAGILAGLSVAANLTFAFPVAALGGTLILIRRRGVFDAFLGPALVFAAVILVLPLAVAKPGAFYYGAPSLYDTAISHLYAGFKHHEGLLVAPIIGAGQRLGPLLMGGVAVLVALATARSLIRREHAWFRAAPAVLAGGVLTLTLVAAGIARLAGFPCPHGRTGMYLIPIGTLAVSLLLGRYRWLLLVPVVIYATQLDSRFFIEWRYDAGTRDMLRRLDQQRVDRSDPLPVTLAVPPALAHTVEYYKLRRNTPWLEMKPITDDSTRYVLLDMERASRAADPAFEVVARHSLSGQALLRRKP